MMQKLTLCARIQAAIIIICCSAVSCSKVEEQQSPDISGQLTSHYCNDPDAANYNVGFPGIPDNSVCVYPYDKFLGEWEVHDSIFKADSSFHEVIIRHFNIQAATFDTNKTAMMIHDWCSTPIEIFCNKYGKAYIKNMLDYPDSAQVVCSNDSIMGTFTLINNEDSAMRISLINKNTVGHFFHKSTAVKR